MKMLRMKSLSGKDGITSLSRSAIYAKIKEGTFPAGIRLGERAVGWRESDIEAWLASRPSNSPVNG